MEIVHGATIGGALEGFYDEATTVGSCTRDTAESNSLQINLCRLHPLKCPAEFSTYLVTECLAGCYQKAQGSSNRSDRFPNLDTLEKMRLMKVKAKTKAKGGGVD